MIEDQPLQESMVHTVPDNDASNNPAPEEESKSASICEQLESLLETGYAELIRTGFEQDEEDDEAAVFVDVPDESPFPKGMAVFDDDDDDEDATGSSSPHSNEGEEDGYEVICRKEIVQQEIDAAQAQA